MLGLKHVIARILEYYYRVQPDSVEEESFICCIVFPPILDDMAVMSQPEVFRFPTVSTYIPTVYSILLVRAHSYPAAAIHPNSFPINIIDAPRQVGSTWPLSHEGKAKRGKRTLGREKREMK